jgi:drug/metabolite transporter (DMT)-like permease
MQCIHNCRDKDPKKRHYFEQPVIQTAQMFIGEMGCWLVVGAFNLIAKYRSASLKRKHANGHSHFSVLPVETDPLLVRGEDDAASDISDSEGEDPLAASMTLSMQNRLPLTGWKVVYLALPACCDIAGTTLMNVGLLFVAASIYQMTRGALVLFVGLFSVVFLKRHLGLYKWFALFVVVAGVAVVGLAGAIESKNKAVSDIVLDSIRSMRGNTDVEIDEVSAAVQTVIGVCLIAAAQIFTATQFVVEESIMEKYAIEPLKAVGWEGIWGFVVTVIGMVLLHFAYGNTAKGQGGYFDMREGLWQVAHFRAIAVSSVLIMISIGYVSTVLLPTKTKLTVTVASTSSVSPSHDQFQRPPGAQSIRAVHCSSGLCLWDLGGRISSGCKWQALRCWFMAPSCSMISLGRR